MVEKLSFAGKIKNLFAKASDPKKGLPKHLILVRHGQSEANLMQKGLVEKPEGFDDRHDAYMRLSPRGRQQAISAGNWLRENGFGKFDRYFVSPHIRTRETAALMALNGEWLVDDLWRERDWGEYGTVHDRKEQAVQYPMSTKIREQNLWYWKPVGGESLATGVRYRVHSVLQLLSMMPEVDAVIGVTHGEFIRTFQFVVERMTPEEWLAMEEDKDQTIRNCMVVHYSRVNPETGKEGPHYKWVRVVSTDPEFPSPHNGEWREIKARKHSDADLMNIVSNYAPLMPQTEPDLGI